jgi:hypothetical protein
MQEALRSSETSVLRRTIRRNIPEDAIHQRNFRRSKVQALQASRRKGLRKAEFVTPFRRCLRMSNANLLCIFVFTKCRQSHTLLRMFYTSGTLLWPGTTLGLPFRSCQAATATPHTLSCQFNGGCDDVRISVHKPPDNLRSRGGSQGSQSSALWLSVCRASSMSVTSGL